MPLGDIAGKYRDLKGDAKPDDLVFRQEDGRHYIDCELLANYLSPILRSLKLKFAGAGWHTFRKVHLTWFSESGATAFEVQEQAGHSSVDTTTLYVIPTLKRREAVLTTMQAGYRIRTEAKTEGPIQ